MNQKGELLFSTSPHLAQEVILHDRADTDSRNLDVPNSLYKLKDDQGRYIVMTGEEFTSFAKQWLRWAAHSHR